MAAGIRSSVERFGHGHVGDELVDRRSRANGPDEERR